MPDDPKNAWETDARCKACGGFMRSQGYTWVDPHVFYFNLKCGYCGKRYRGKKRSVESYVIDWEGWEDLRVVPKESKINTAKKYMTAKRRK